MKIVSNFNELITNSQTLDGYLRSQVDPEYDFALNLIKKGTCFVAVGVSGAYKFYPSRFIGYADNSMDAHLNNVEKDGKETNPAISKILLVPDDSFSLILKLTFPIISSFALYLLCVVIALSSYLFSSLASSMSVNPSCIS